MTYTSYRETYRDYLDRIANGPDAVRPQVNYPQQTPQNVAPRVELPSAPNIFRGDYSPNRPAPTPPPLPSTAGMQASGSMSDLLAGKRVTYSPLNTPPVPSSGSLMDRLAGNTPRSINNPILSPTGESFTPSSSGVLPSATRGLQPILNNPFGGAAANVLAGAAAAAALAAASGKDPFTAAGESLKNQAFDSLIPKLLPTDPLSAPYNNFREGLLDKLRGALPQFFPKRLGNHFPNPNRKNPQGSAPNLNDPANYPFNFSRPNGVKLRIFSTNNGAWFERVVNGFTITKNGEGAPYPYTIEIFNTDGTSGKIDVDPNTLSVANPDGSPLDLQKPGTPIPLRDTNGNPVQQGTNPSPTSNPQVWPPLTESPVNPLPQTIKPGSNPTTTPKGPEQFPSIPFLPLPIPLPGRLPQTGANPSPQIAPLNSPSSGNGSPAPTLKPVENNVPTLGKQPHTTSLPGERIQPSIAPITQPFTPNLNPGGGDKCCPATQQGLEDIKAHLGVGQLPTALPLLKGAVPVPITNMLELNTWIVRNLDAVSGYWPATVRVLQPNGTEKTITLKNQAHAMEELFYAALSIAEDADAGVNIGARIATEVINTKIAVQQSGDLIRAIQRFLGFAVKAIPRKVKLNFSPTAAGPDGKLQNNEMEGFLKNSEQLYQGSELDDKSEALPMLQRILQNSEICRMAVWRPLKPDKTGNVPLTGDRLREQKTGQTEAQKKQWEEFIKQKKEQGFEIKDKSGVKKIIK